MQKPKVLVIASPQAETLQALAPVRELCEVTLSDEQTTLVRAAATADVLLVIDMPAQIDFAAIWSAAHGVRWIHSLLAGVEKLLVPQVLASDVPLSNARGVFKRSLAEFALLGMLFHRKQVRRLITNQQQRQWDHFTVDWINGRTMGVFGYGEIGRECALLAKGMGMKIHALRRRADQAAADPLIDRLFEAHELEAMLPGIDVLLCAAPLTPATRHRIGAAQFALMKSDAILINVGRGPVVDEGALIGALQTGKIAAASLDVFEREPLSADSPLWTMDQVLLSPHCAGVTREPSWLQISVQLFIENLQRWQRGAPLGNLVDKQAGY